MAGDYLLEIDEIKGESKDKKHKDTIEVDSFSWGGTNPGMFHTGGGGGRGKTTFQDISFTARPSKASPLLAEAMTRHKHIKTATLYVRKRGGAGAEDFYKVILQEAAVVSYTSTGSGAGDEHNEYESFSLAFAKITFEYREQDDKGVLQPAVSFEHNIKTGDKT